MRAYMWRRLRFFEMRISPRLSKWCYDRPRLCVHLPMPPNEEVKPSCSVVVFTVQSVFEQWYKILFF